MSEINRNKKILFVFKKIDFIAYLFFPLFYEHIFN